MSKRREVFRVELQYIQKGGGIYFDRLQLLAESPQQATRMALRYSKPEYLSLYSLWKIEITPLTGERS